MFRGERKLVKKGAVLLGGILILSFLFFTSRHPLPWETSEKRITIIDGGLEILTKSVSSATVLDLLQKEQVSLNAEDTLFPAPDTTITPGMKIHILRSKEITVVADGETKSFRTQAPDVETALSDAHIVLDEDDIVKPGRTDLVIPKMSIAITRVLIEEKIVDKEIAFAKKINEDDKLSWRKTVTTQKGEKGIERQTYRVSSHDGKEVNRKLIKTEIIKEPVTEIVTQGTYVKLGKSHTGAASWYAWTGTLAAANPWLPKGSYVKVTNVDNGKSVIVVINDRGPFVPGRIIDLDKVAFQKIASLGAGVINVKMEEITN